MYVADAIGNVMENTILTVSGPLLKAFCDRSV